jgi:phage terminase large subunit
VQVDIPYHYTPRTLQRPFLEAMARSGVDRACLVWPRRFGKETTCLNFTITRMLQRPGLYVHMFPEFAQGRRILWEGMNDDGFRFRDYFHPSIVAKRRDGSLDMDEQEMRIRLVNGAIWQVAGSDRYDAVRGGNPVGIVMSEYSYQNPRAWVVLSPIFNANRGWAIFNFTPNGKNHAWKLYNGAQKLDNWFVQKLTLAETQHVPASKIAEDLALGVLTDEDVQQEYYCSFDSGSFGSYYGRLLAQAYTDQRVGLVPWDPMLPVITAWDIGVDDETVIWFMQLGSREIRVIDYYQNSGEGLPHYAALLRSKGYVYQQHLLPHDVEVKEWGTGRTRRAIAQGLGIQPIKTVQRPQDKGDTHESVRRILPRCVFDATKCDKGLDALVSYKKDWDEKLQTFKRLPKHDWASHPADAFGTFALGFTESSATTTPRAEYAEISYDVLNRTTMAPPPYPSFKPYTQRLRDVGALPTETIR